MSTPTSAARALAVVEALAGCGVAHVVYSPGSRNAPLAYALAAAEDAGWLRVHVRTDERSAAFFALGLARASEAENHAARPVALTMTSGTAVANAHPALLEAAHACVPLIAISADRPESMRGTGANQTTEHTHLFAGTVRGTWDVPADAGADAVAGAVGAAVGVARGGVPGPVHINCQFDTPLRPEAPLTLSAHPRRPRIGEAAAAVPSRLARRAEVARLVPLAPAALPSARPRLGDLGLDAGAPGLIIAGNQAAQCAGGPDLPELARALGWPLLAEPTSGVRARPALAHYQQVLAGRPELAAEARQVLVVGHPTLSRPVTGLLTGPGRRVVAVARAGTYTNLAGAVDAVAASVPLPPERPVPAPGWLSRWEEADAALAPADVREHVCATLWARHAERGPRPPILVLGASMTIRACDRAAEPGESAPSALANRGLAGIDGTIATARGVAAASTRPVRAIMGDLTFFHDVGSLATGRFERDEEAVQVIVLNDAGGAIFSSLEYGADASSPLFGRYFSTPQRASIAGLAAAYDWEYIACESLAQLDYLAALPVRGRSIVEVNITTHPSTAQQTSSFGPSDGQF